MRLGLGLGIITLTCFDGQNPFTAYNCTWGFHHPQLFPADDSGCARAGVEGAIGSVRAAVELLERGNSTTCPRQAGPFQHL